VLPGGNARLDARATIKTDDLCFLTAPTFQTGSENTPGSTTSNAWENGRGEVRRGLLRQGRHFRGALTAPKKKSAPFPNR
jgi:hypothetical protein